MTDQRVEVKVGPNQASKFLLLVWGRVISGKVFPPIFRSQYCPLAADLLALRYPPVHDIDIVQSILGLPLSLGKNSDPGRTILPRGPPADLQNPPPNDALLEQHH